MKKKNSQEYDPDYVSPFKVKKVEKSAPDFFIVINNMKELKIYVNQIIKKSEQRPVFRQHIMDAMKKDNITMPMDIALDTDNLLFLRNHVDKKPVISKD